MNASSSEEVLLYSEHVFVWDPQGVHHPVFSGIGRRWALPAPIHGVPASPVPLPQNGPKVAAAAGPPVKVSVLSLLDGAGPIAVQGVNGKATAPAPRQRSAVGRAGAGGGALPNGGPDSVARRRVTAATAAAAGRGPIPPAKHSHPESQLPQAVGISPPAVPLQDIRTLFDGRPRGGWGYKGV